MRQRISWFLGLIMGFLELSCIAATTKHSPIASRQGETPRLSHIYQTTILESVSSYHVRRLQDDCNNNQNETCAPSSVPTAFPNPTSAPTSPPSTFPPISPTSSPSTRPTKSPTIAPSVSPTAQPTGLPTAFPSFAPTSSPSARPSLAPTTKPSVLPSGNPSVSPTASPTVRPTTLSPTTLPSGRPSSAPSFSPSYSPTPIPSVAPSPSPSAKPTEVPTDRPTPAPTMSPTDPPTFSPTTEAPSTIPSVLPTVTPTESSQPSDSPTISFAPTIDPFGVDQSIKLDDNDNRAITVTCRPDIPNSARDVTDQLIQYDYVLNVPNGTIMSFVLSDVEEKVSAALTQIFLDCRYTLVREFYIHALNSAPNDRIASGCLQVESVEGFTCYSISGQLVATIFYLDVGEDVTRRKLRQNDVPKRQLQGDGSRETQIADERVADAFTTALNRIFNQTSFESVVASSFAGIINRIPPPPPPPENRTPQIVGGTIGGLVGAVLVGYVIVMLLKRHTEEAENQYYQQAMDAIDAEIDDVQTLPAEIQPTTSRVVNDDEDQEDTVESDVPVYSATKPYPRSRAVEFIGTVQGDQEIQVSPAATSPIQRERMIEETKRELGPATYDSKISRGYGVSNTVDL